jgi:uncharacterized protein (DUF1330 family)
MSLFLGTSHDTLSGASFGVVYLSTSGNTPAVRGSMHRQIFIVKMESWQHVASCGNSVQMLQKDFESAASASSAIPARESSFYR